MDLETYLFNKWGEMGILLTTVVFPGLGVAMDHGPFRVR
jgi:hypothetical protein